MKLFRYFSDVNRKTNGTLLIAFLVISNLTISLSLGFNNIPILPMEPEEAKLSLSIALSFLNSLTLIS